MRMSISLRRHATLIVLASSTCELSSCFEEVRCDALIKDDAWDDFEILILDSEFGGVVDGANRCW